MNNIDITDVILYGVMAFVAIAVVILIGFGVFEIVDRMRGRDKWYAGVIAEKSFTPSSTSTGVGPVVGGSNNGGVSVVVSSTEEKWTLLIDCQHQFDELQQFQATAKTYKAAKVGQKVKLLYTQGRYSGKLYGPREMETL